MKLLQDITTKVAAFNISRGSQNGEVNRGDRIFRFITASFAALIVLMLGAMALQMLRASAPAIREFGLGFVVSRDWDPVRDLFGALPFIFGTVVSSILALIIAVPISLGIAIYLSELSPSMVRKPLGFIVELLAAIPSVVYGLWGIFVLAPLLRDDIEPGLLPIFGGAARGFDMLAGGLILAIMVLPTITSVSREVMRAVPKTLREGALALGATRFETVYTAVLPTAYSGIIGAVILGLGRALGETMAVTMVIGNRAEISTSILDPAYTMASVIANEYTEATGDLHLAALSEIALLLFAVTVILNIAARLLVWRVKRMPSG
ncbi:MAG: phosphate ABC transporter permease subunit PstC [Deltaproteobacteria bacterium]|nr:phosphate ABC transporter permease subunit PstC [Deltaproteobacteria bacterium]